MIWDSLLDLLNTEHFIASFNAKIFVEGIEYDREEYIFVGTTAPDIA